MRRGRILTGLLASMLYAAPAQASSITLESATVDPGDVFSLSVSAQDVDDLLAYAFTVVFDPNFLELVSVADAEALGVDGVDAFPCKFPVADPSIELECPRFTPDSVSVGNLAISGVDIGAAGDTLTFLTFRALLEGLTNVSLTNVSLSTVLVEEILLPDSGSQVQIGDITQVPEPATILLIWVGLAAVARRRRQRI